MGRGGGGEEGAADIRVTDHFVPIPPSAILPWVRKVVSRINDCIFVWYMLCSRSSRSEGRVCCAYAYAALNRKWSLIFQLLKVKNVDTNFSREFSHAGKKKKHNMEKRKRRGSQMKGAGWRRVLGRKMVIFFLFCFLWRRWGGGWGVRDWRDESLLSHRIVFGFLRIGYFFSWWRGKKYSTSA